MNLKKKSLCRCGDPIHYSDPETEKRVQKIVDELGEFIEVIVPGKGTYKVQRHYIALHSIKGEDLGKLGFQKIK